MKKRTLMISDIHGCLAQLDALLALVAYDSKDDQLMLLGDYVDRGPESKGVVARVIDLVENHEAIALRGNHDQRFVEWVRGGSKPVQAKLLDHGGLATLRSYCDFIGDRPDESTLREARAFISTTYADHIQFLGSLPLYAEDHSHICVHAGINPKYAHWRQQPEDDFMYIKGEFTQSATRVDKMVVFGHTRAVEIHGQSEIWFGGDKIGIDGGCAYGQQLNALMYAEGSYSTESVKNKQ